MDRTKKVLITLLVVGALATVGVGTYATFTAQTTNAGNTVTTGSLVLSNTVNAPATACLSTGAGTTTDANANPSCGAFFTLGTAGPGSNATATLQLKNVGSLGASSLVVFAPSCSSAANGTYSGTGNLCSVLEFYIQQTNSSGTPTACIYGGGTATTCAFTSADTVSAFATAYPSAAGGLALGGLSAGTTDYYTIGVQVDSGAGNNMQGQQASFNVSWNASF
jgi:hypothetical protein